MKDNVVSQENGVSVIPVAVYHQLVNGINYKVITAIKDNANKKVDLSHAVVYSGPFSEDFAVDTEIPKGLVAVYWKTADGTDVHRTRRLNILGDVLGDRLRVKVREQLGSTYSPNVASLPSDIFPGYGYMEAAVIVDPAKVKPIEDVVVSVAADMSANGITQDELDRAKNPKLTALRESERTNSYWMTVLIRAQEKPEVLDWARSRKADFESITKEDIDLLAKEYLRADLASRVIIHPYPAPVGTGPLKAAPPPPDGM